jgi:hypothetical protein
MTDFTGGIPTWVPDMLEEMTEQDRRLGELFVDVIMDERPPGDKEVHEAMRPATFEKLMTIPSFRDRYDQKHAEGLAAGKAEGRAAGKAEDLMEYFRAKRDELSVHALAAIRECTDAAILSGWLSQAYQGRTSAEIFGPGPR